MGRGGDLRAAARYARGLGRFLRDRPTEADCEQLLVRRLGERTDTFLTLMEEGVFGRGRSPYRRLLHWAGAEMGDVERSVRDLGVEATLERLYDAGVYVTMDELSGKRPLTRPGLEIPVREEDFDNPLAAGEYDGQSGGSSGAPRRLRFELALMAHEAAHVGVMLRTAGLADRTAALWRPVPPGIAGMNNVLRYARLGKAVERWFSQYPLVSRPGDLRYAAFTAYTIRAARRAGLPVAAPEHAPLDRPEVVVSWLAGRVAEGARIVLSTPATAAVRLCASAVERGLDVSGTVFRIGGEPYTEAREHALEDAGCTALSQYAMAELGIVGTPCADPAARDDVHVLDEKLALIRRERAVDPAGSTIGELVLTTIAPTTPKLLLNAHSGDHAVLEERTCACRFGELGFRRHLHTIRSHEKVTSEGMNLAGADLLTLVEDVLPSRLGGRPADYQLVEEEVDGLPRLSVLVSPRVGSVDERQALDVVLGFLRREGDEGRLTARLFEDVSTLRVVRRDPYATASAKIWPLHVLERDGRVSPRPLSRAPGS
jgi:hypothetical protein